MVSARPPRHLRTEISNMRKAALSSALLLATTLCTAQTVTSAHPAPAGTGVISAQASQSSPTTFDGIARAFANSICAVTGCIVQAEPAYNMLNERMRFWDQANSPPFIPSGSRLVDERGGGNRNLSVDLTGPLDSIKKMPVAIPWSDECYGHTTASAYDCATITQNDLFSGYSIGNPAGDAKAQGWTANSALVVNKFSPSAGISAGMTLNVTKNGIGDAQGMYAYVFGRGGARSASDEALEIYAGNGGEAGPPAFAATVTSVNSSHTRVALKPLRANGSEGAGRMLIDTTPSSLVASGCITSMAKAKNPAGKDIEITQFTLGCGASVKNTATSWGTLAATIDPPILPSSSDTSKTTTDSTVDFYAYSGAPAVGDIGCFSGVVRDGFHEAATIVAVAPGNQPKHFNVTYATRVRHPAGSFVVHGKTGCMGLELRANTFGTPDTPPDYKGLRYVLDTLGCSDAHTCWAVQFQGSGSNPFNPALMNMSVNPTTAPLVNKDGVVTIPLTSSNTISFPLFVGVPVITISNADDPAFNGACTDTHVAPGAPVNTIDCTQSSSKGHSSKTSGATVTLGDTGYGNTRFNLFYEAQVLDFKDYSKSPPQLAENPILRLEPNGMPMPIGGTVEEPNDYAAGYVGLHLGTQVFNPYTTNKLFDVGTVPVWDSRNAAWDLTNLSYEGRFIHEYVGLGGTRQPPRGYTLSGFPWSYFGKMDKLPWPSGSALFSVGDCPMSPLGCADPNYDILIDGFPGNNFYYRERWTPYTNTRSFEGPHHTFPGAPTVTGKMKYACFNDKMELVAKVTPCDQDP
jgi:hypothetical protein